MQEAQEKQNLDMKYVGSKGLNYLAAKYENSPGFIQNSDNMMGFKIVEPMSHSKGGVSKEGVFNPYLQSSNMNESKGSKDISPVHLSSPPKIPTPIQAFQIQQSLVHEMKTPFDDDYEDPAPQQKTSLNLASRE